MSRCISLSGYLHGVLPVPTIAAQIVVYGKSPFTWMWRSAGNPNTVHRSPISSASDPIALARKLIQLALCLIQPAFIASKPAEFCIADSAIHETARGYVRTAQQVTSQDELVRSVDGLETLLLEGLYQVHNGNMQNGCMIFRRALETAQAMGLHQLPATADPRVKYIWFRLAFANQWHALACGQPSALINNGVDAFSCSLTTEPTQRLDELHIGVTGRIIARNMCLSKACYSDAKAEYLRWNHENTKDIDSNLKKAARSVPLTWWALPSTPCTTDSEAVDMSARLMTQIHQSYLVILTHQPHLLRAFHTLSPQNIHDTDLESVVPYSMLASVDASREILVRLPLFLQFPHVPASLKGLEHKICLAASTILLAYLYLHCQRTASALEHRRPRDLNLVPETVARLKKLHESGGDDGQDEQVNIIERLADMEQAAADGVVHTVWSEWSAEGQKMSDIFEFDGVVNLSCPYFGRIAVFQP